MIKGNTDRLVKIFLVLSFFWLNQYQTAAQDNRLHIITLEAAPQIDFAIGELTKTLTRNNFLVEKKQVLIEVTNPTIVFIPVNHDESPAYFSKYKLSKDNLQKEGFSIKLGEADHPLIFVVAPDNAGLMYGGLELEEQISQKGIDQIEKITLNPYMHMRGTKFNIPLDVRTPSYSDVSDAAQQNMEEMWSMEFWKEYIDNMARYRYNFISLWSLHPFPSLIKLDDYPDIALDDVQRSTVDWEENYSLNGHGFNAPEIVNNYEVIKKISIEEKIEFWRKVMRYGKERNIDFYFITWNIFTNGTDGKYGITDKVDNPVTRDYFRQSVREMLLTYPDLAGIGLTTGENMYGLSTDVKENWAFETYGQGVLDVANMQPERKITFIHRQHQTGALEVANTFKPLVEQQNVNFIFSFKYAKAHVYSSINQVFHQGFVKDIRKDDDLKTIWTLRNDDIYYFRWGAPDYVRDFIKNIPHEVSEGYYYGSDQYIWGREFLNKYPTGKRDIEVVKHWYHWMIWGRLGYNPDMENIRFIRVLQDSFPTVNANELFNAWQHASMIYPLVTGFHWGSLDFQWYIESGQSRPAPANTPSGYHDVNRFISLEPHKGTGYLSIYQYIENTLGEKNHKGKTPLEVADEITHNADKALKWANGIESPMDIRLLHTINDIKSMAYLGKYYAHKIKAATNLALFRETFNPNTHAIVIDELKTSALYWRYYASNSLFLHINPLWTNRVGIVDWKETFNLALYDITANGGDHKLPGMISTSNGLILEAEEAEHALSKVQNSYPGFTGSGYLESFHGDAIQTVKWDVDAPKAGIYSLEFRYSLKRQEEFVGAIYINGKKQTVMDFWPSGSPETWVWDKINVPLQKGKNTIEVKVEGFVLFDHLNVLYYTQDVDLRD